jgi:hypothetical protein
MLKTQRLLCALIVLPAVYAFATPVEEFKFSVASGTALSRTIEQETEMSLDNMSMYQNETDMSGMMGKMEVTAKSKLTIKVSDKFVEMGDGAPNKLERTFETLSNATSVSMQADNPMIPSSDKDISGKSELEGKVVLFTRDGDGYKRTFGEDSTGDDEILAELDEDLDFRAFVPRGRKSVGDGWTIELDEFKKLLAPGGNLQIEMQQVEEDQMGFGSMGSEGNLWDQLGDLEGEVKAEFIKLEGDGAAQVAVVKRHDRAGPRGDGKEQGQDAGRGDRRRIGRRRARLQGRGRAALEPQRGPPAQHRGLRGDGDGDGERDEGQHDGPEHVVPHEHGNERQLHAEDRDRRLIRARRSAHDKAPNA